MTEWPATLRDYQRQACDLILEHPRMELVLRMGFGKTLCTLTAMQYLLDRFEVMSVLIVAPKRVALHTWPEEIDKWEHVDFGYSVVMGNPAQRQQAAASVERVHITNIDNLVWLIEHHGKNWPYDMVVIDEASMFKRHNTRRFKALKRRLSEIDRVLLLTGTPAPNGVMDLWPQVFLLDNGQRLFRTITAFRQHYYIKGYRGDWDWELRPGAEEEIYHRVSDIVFRLDGEVDLPGRLDVTVAVDLPTKARAQYEELERESLLELTEENITADTAAVLVGKLLQMANGAIYAGDDWELIHAAKVAALQEIVNTAAGQPVLVAYYFKHDRERLLDAFPAAIALGDDPETIRAWNRGEIEMLLVHPQSAGHGLNLQHGGSILVWFGLVWSLELYQQTVARLDRSGQQNQVVVHHLVARDTVDEDVMRVLGDKDASQQRLLDALKERAA